MIWNSRDPVNRHGIRFSIGIGFISNTGINFGNFSGICSIGVGTGIDTGFGTGISTVFGTGIGSCIGTGIETGFGASIGIFCALGIDIIVNGSRRGTRNFRGIGIRSGIGV